MPDKSTQCYLLCGTLPAVNALSHCNLPPTGQYLDCLVCLHGSALNNNRSKKRLFSLMNGVLNIKCQSSLKFSFCQKLRWQPKCAWLICLYELPTYHWKPLQQLDKRTVRENCSCQVSNTMAYFLSVNTRCERSFLICSITRTLLKTLNGTYIMVHTRNNV